MIWAFAALCMLAMAAAMAAVLFAHWCELRAENERWISPERPAGWPGADAVFLRPDDGEDWRPGVEVSR